MKKKTFFTLLFILLVAFSCTSTNNEQSSDTTKESETTEAPKDATQLTWRQVVAIVYEDQAEGIEWHGEEMPNELADLLTIDTGEPCGEADCGTRLLLTSSAEKTMTVIIKGDYNIEGDQGYIPRKYTIEPDETLVIGCSHLCYEGKSYEFLREIVGTEYVDKQA